MLPEGGKRFHVRRAQAFLQLHLSGFDATGGIGIGLFEAAQVTIVKIRDAKATRGRLSLQRLTPSLPREGKSREGIDNLSLWLRGDRFRLWRNGRGRQCGIGGNNSRHIIGGETKHIAQFPETDSKSDGK